jgi:hypothetical protein
LFRQSLGARDVALLARLVAAAKQQDHQPVAPREIDAVARPVIDSQFLHARADRFRVTEQADLNAAIRRLIALTAIASRIPASQSRNIRVWRTSNIVRP